MTEKIAQSPLQQMRLDAPSEVRERIGRALAWMEQGDLQAARAVLAALDERLGQAADGAEQSVAPHARRADGTGLTRAELRVLGCLRTHLTLAQIGERLFVSRNTVSSQTASVYRKLGVGARAAAVEEAIRRGLLPA